MLSQILGSIKNNVILRDDYQRATVVPCLVPSSEVAKASFLFPLTVARIMNISIIARFYIGDT